MGYRMLIAACNPGVSYPRLQAGGDGDTFIFTSYDDDDDDDESGEDDVETGDEAESADGADEVRRQI